MLDQITVPIKPFLIFSNDAAHCYILGKVLISKTLLVLVVIFGLARRSIFKRSDSKRKSKKDLKYVKCSSFTYQFTWVATNKQHSTKTSYIDPREVTKSAWLLTNTFQKEKVVVSDSVTVVPILNNEISAVPKQVFFFPRQSSLPWY